MPDYSMFVPNVHFELIPIKNLVSNQSAREICPCAMCKMPAEHFDLYQIQPCQR